MIDPAAAGLGLGAAFIAGLAASGHCLAMCGGITGALAMRNAQSGATSRVANVATYNLARITSYAIAGAIAGLLGAVLLDAVNVRPLSVTFRVLAGLIMLAAGGRLLFGWRFLDPIESAGSGLWRRIAPWAARSSRAGGLSGSLGLGLAWGWLPCGMTYSMLLLAATTANVATGALTMVAFGAGTLPSMVTAGLAFDRFARALSSRASMRRIAGVLLVAFGLWTVGQSLYALGAAGHASHSAGGHGQVEGEPAQPDHSMHQHHP